MTFLNTLLKYKEVKLNGESKMSLKTHLTNFVSNLNFGKVSNSTTVQPKSNLPLGETNYYQGVEIIPVSANSEYEDKITELSIVFSALPMPDTRNIQPFTEADLAFADTVCDCSFFRSTIRGTSTPFTPTFCISIPLLSFCF